MAQGINFGQNNWSVEVIGQEIHDDLFMIQVLENGYAPKLDKKIEAEKYEENFKDFFQKIFEAHVSGQKSCKLKNVLTNTRETKVILLKTLFEKTLGIKTTVVKKSEAPFKGGTYTFKFEWESGDQFAKVKSELDNWIHPKK